MTYFTHRLYREKRQLYSRRDATVFEIAASADFGDVKSAPKVFYGISLFFAVPLFNRAFAAAAELVSLMCIGHHSRKLSA